MSDIVGDVFNTVGEVAETFADGIQYDAQKMAEAANYINSQFETFADDIEAVSEKVQEGINSSDGTCIKTPTSADAIYKVWDEAVDVKLKDFIQNFNSWSEVMAIVNATGAEYADETVTTYTNDDGETFNFADEGTIEGLQAALGVRGTDRVNGVLDSTKTYTQTEWDAEMKTLSEVERAAVKERNTDTAKGLHDEYERYLTMSKDDSSYEYVRKRIESQNPEVRAMLRTEHSKRHHR